MNSLITGDKGFIGSKFKGIGFDIKDGKDIRDRLALEVLFETNQIDTVIHCAALTGVRRGELYPEEYISTNILGTKNLVDMAEKYKVKHFIHFSSSSVYSEFGKFPLSELALLEPDSVYGITKLAAEKIVKRSNLNWCIVRPFTVYGEYGRPDQVLEKWINQAKSGKPVSFYGDGSSGRGYTYIGDLVKGIEAIIEKKACGIFNLGGNEFITLKQLWDICGQPNAEMLPMPKGDRIGIFANICKANSVLGWEPKVQFTAMVRAIWETRVGNIR